MILCIGTTPTGQRSMVFDRLTLDGVNRATAVSEYASGKSINVARVLQTLGKSACCTGFVGGPRGKMIRDHLDALTIQHNFVDVQPPTRLCTTIIDHSTNTATELVEESAEVEPGAWTELDQRIASAGQAAAVWVMSGSLPPHGDLDAYARWTRAGLAAGARVIIDGRGQPVRRALPIGKLILKLNQDELAATLETSITNQITLKAAMLKSLPADGAIVVTLGKDGAIATNGHDYWHVTTPSVRVISAVGSGDSFAAGLAAGFADHRTLPESLKLAAACGAANAMTDRAGQINPSDLDHILATTVVAPA
ncbi:MAG TPA: hexose kinase [Tepidisphaeraceae bacterium]|nr:hexose kinase [Tepidisphaeraceae bacterium]